MPEELPLAPEELDALRGITSPTVCNAIETFGVRDHAEGFMGPEIRCVFPQLDVMVGYACTAVIGAKVAGGSRSAPAMPELWKHVASVPGPRVLVIHDVDSPRPLGSFWGEVNANIFRAQGVIGTVTDGGVRDLDEVGEMGFHYFAAEVLVSHANLRLIDVGVPVEVGGLRVEPGDLVHGDKHGVVKIPPAIARQVPEAAAKIEKAERGIIDFCKSSDFSIDKLMQAFGSKHR